MKIYFHTAVEEIQNLKVIKISDRIVRGTRIVKWCMWGNQDSFKQWVGVSEDGTVYFTSNVPGDRLGPNREEALMVALKRLNVISLETQKAWLQEQASRRRSARLAGQAQDALIALDDLGIKVSKRERARLQRIAQSGDSPRPLPSRPATQTAGRGATRAARS